ncbi:recombinase family protein [bacterium]|jgi:DNA invertase Pin-like site-specific DNA recombinase|nr:recombinase family protein [bacterium]
MTKVGYRRVSSIEQNLDRQELIGCDKVFEEKVSGASKERKAMKDMMDWVREGDEVLVWSIDRLARDLRDLQDIISTLNNKGVSISFISEGLSFSVEKNDALAKLQLQMMGAFSEFERSIIRKRQAEGIAKAKEKGVYRGRKATIDAREVMSLKEKGLGASAIAKQLGIGRASVYRVIQQ